MSTAHGKSLRHAHHPSRGQCVHGHIEHGPLHPGVRTAHGDGHAPDESRHAHAGAAPAVHGHDLLHDHNHEHGHSHSHDLRSVDKSMLSWSFAVTVVMMVVEIGAGLYTESLALVSDGVHMFTHSFALGVSFAAIVLTSRPASLEKSFGYHRLEVVAAFTNGITVLASAAWILYEAVARFYAPREIQVMNTLYIAVVGLVVNLITGAMLMRADQGNLNIKSAFLHMLTDALSSVAIIVGLIVIYFTGWEWIDALLAAVVSAVIVKWSWSLLRDSMHILLEGSPVDVEQVTAHVLRNYPEVVDVHDVHVWQISQRFYCLTAHLHIQPDAIFGYPRLVDRLNADLREHFGIGHTNFQPEWRS